MVDKDKPETASGESSQDEHVVRVNKGTKVVYVVDTGFVMFAKFAGALLAIFFVVGVFLYGYDLKKASEELDEVTNDLQDSRSAVQVIRAETLQIKIETMAAKAAVLESHEEMKRVSSELQRDIDKIDDIIASSQRDLAEAQRMMAAIRGFRQQAEVEVAAIENPISESEARQLVDTVIAEKLRAVLDPAQLRKLSEASPRPVDDVRTLAQQPAIELVRADDAARAAPDAEPVTVALLCDPVAELDALAGQLLPPKVVTNLQASELQNHHGTSVAAMIAAVAPNARILPIVVLNKTGAGQDRDIFNGLRFAAVSDASILVVPLTMKADDARFDAAIEELAIRDILVVASRVHARGAISGEPKRHPNLIDVAPTDEHGDLMSIYAPWGSWLQLAAPGSVRTLGLRGQPIDMRGGSYAMAVTAAVAALVRGVNPQLTAEETKSILVQTAVPMPGADVGFGRLDALTAVQTAARRR